MLLIFKIKWDSQIMLFSGWIWDLVKKNASDGNITEEWETHTSQAVFRKKHKKLNYQNFISVTNYHNHN